MREVVEVVCLMLSQLVSVLMFSVQCDGGVSKDCQGSSPATGPAHC